MSDLVGLVREFPIGFLIALGLAGCMPAHIPSAVSPTTPQCIDLYLHNLSLTLKQEIEPGKDYPPDVLELALLNLNDEYMESGLARKQVLYCQHQLTLPQVACMTQAQTISAMSSCESTHHKE